MRLEAIAVTAAGNVARQRHEVPVYHSVTAGHLTRQGRHIGPGHPC